MTYPEDVTTLLPDERTDDKVRCRVCGKWVPFERSRLFYIDGGTVRTCKRGMARHD